MSNAPGDGRTVADGDAAAHLEDLLAGAAPVAPEPEVIDTPSLSVEMVGPHLRVVGQIVLGRFRRLSDVLNNQFGLLEIREARVLYRNGNPTHVVTPRLWINLTEVTLIGQMENAALASASPEFRVTKDRQPLIVVTPGHTLTGEVYITVGAELAGFIESPDPPFIPMTDVRTRSLADRRVISRYIFALLNRRHIVATTLMLPGMMGPGRTL
jgi:hypothetical protein